MLNTRGAFQAFLADPDKKVFQFEITCPIEERIRFIYSVIFPGLGKYRFFWNFFLARMARFVDISAVKVFLYRRIGVRIGRGVFISPDVIIDPHFPSLITIGDHAILGWGAHIFPHDFDGTKYRAGRIAIGRGAVIGGFATIRGGVAIGENASVASLSIVIKDVPKNYLVDSVVLFSKALTETYRKQRDL